MFNVLISTEDSDGTTKTLKFRPCLLDFVPEKTE